MFPCVIVFGVCVFVVVVFVFRNVCCCVFEDCVGVCVFVFVFLSWLCLLCFCQLCCICHLLTIIIVCFVVLLCVSVLLFRCV